MENSIYIGLSRQTALRREMSVVANNIANVDTTGFKREMMIYQSYPEKAPFDRTETQFVIDRATATDYAQGPLKVTGKTLDLAIDGPGYFTVDDGTGTFYTRNGTLSLNDQNQLTTNQGHLVLDPAGNPIFIPRSDDAIVVTGDGSVALGDEVYGRIAVVEFDKVAALKKERDSLFATDAQPFPAENSQVAQGQLEGSNVNAIVEMTEMMTIHRTYDAIKNLIDSEGQRAERATQRLARPMQVA